MNRKTQKLCARGVHGGPDCVIRVDSISFLERATQRRSEMLHTNAVQEAPFPSNLPINLRNNPNRYIRMRVCLSLSSDPSYCALSEEYTPYMTEAQRRADSDCNIAEVIDIARDKLSSAQHFEWCKQSQTFFD
jgi:hypothetical protein